MKLNKNKKAFPCAEAPDEILYSNLELDEEDVAMLSGHTYHGKFIKILKGRVKLTYPEPKYKPFGYVSYAKEIIKIIDKAGDDILVYFGTESGHFKGLIE